MTDDETARCLCQWVSPLDGVIRQEWPAETDPRCPVHGHESYREHSVIEIDWDDENHES